MNFDLRIDRVAAGGDGLGHAPDGRVVFVPGGLPGDELRVEVVQAKKQFVRAKINSILEPSPGRTAPPCPYVAQGCGGCDWQHASPTLQTESRIMIVRDALRRLGKLGEVDVRPGPALPVDGYRTTVRCLVANGRAAFRKANSHDALIPERCLVAHPAIQEIMAQSNFGRNEEVTIRVGARTGEAMVQLDQPDGVSVPDGVIVGDHEQPAFIHEEVAGHRYRISGTSFFQCRPDGADAMVSLAEEAIAGFDGRLVDAYAGVGLFGAALGHDRDLTAVELAPSSVADARVNLPAGSSIIESAVERWSPVAAAAVIADPARRGLGRDGVDVLAATGASVIALVSCDPAALGRDAGLLVAAGYQLEWVRVLDMFGHTSHVEAVSRFVRD